MHNISESLVVTRNSDCMQPTSGAIHARVPKTSSNAMLYVACGFNSEAITLAKEAIYRERNVSQIPTNLQEKYFQRINDKFHLSDLYKQRVNFKTMNIFSSEFEALEKFDFILSRNMLIYFDAEDKQRVKKLLQDKLKNPENSVFYGHADLF